PRSVDGEREVAAERRREVVAERDAEIVLRVLLDVLAVRFELRKSHQVVEHRERRPGETGDRQLRVGRNELEGPRRRRLGQPARDTVALAAEGQLGTLGPLLA